MLVVEGTRSTSWSDDEMMEVEDIRELPDTSVQQGESAAVKDTDDDLEEPDRFSENSFSGK